MYTRILVPLDGTTVAEAALSYAQTLARRAHGSIILLRVVARGAGNQISSADIYLQAIAHGLEKRGITVEIAMQSGGHVTDWIAEEARAHRADLVVMGTHGRGGVDRLLHRSVARSVFPRLDIPVLVVNAAAESNLEAERFQQPSPSVVVGLDGSDFAEAALTPARDLATLLGARIILVEAVPDNRPEVMTASLGPVAYVDDEMQTRLVQEAQDYLLETQRSLRAEGFEAYVDVRVGEPAEQLRQAAAGHSAAVLVVASHGRTGIKRMLLGSVANALLSRTGAPVLVVPARAVESRAASGVDTELVGVNA